MLNYISIPLREPIGNAEAVHLALEQAGVDYRIMNEPQSLRGAPRPILWNPEGRFQSGTLHILESNCSALGLDSTHPDLSPPMNYIAIRAFDHFNKDLYEWTTYGDLELSDEVERLRRRYWARQWVNDGLPYRLSNLQEILPAPISNSTPWSHGEKLSYVDLLIFQVCVLLKSKSQVNLEY